MPGGIQRLAGTEEPAAEIVRQTFAAGATGSMQNEDRLAIRIAQDGVTQSERRNDFAAVEPEIVHDEFMRDGNPPRNS